MNDWQPRPHRIELSVSTPPVPPKMVAGGQPERAGSIIFVLVFAAVLFLLVAGSGGQSNPTNANDRPTADPFIVTIGQITDCAELQGIFETAWESHQLAKDNGSLPAMKSADARMDAADDRMWGIGCYGD